MSDLVSKDLRAWFAHRDRAAFERAYVRLQNEAGAVLRRLEPWRTPEERTQRAQEVVHLLLFPVDSSGRSISACKLLPELDQASAAPVYRAKVFFSAIIDEQRARLRHQELEQGFANPLTAAAVREARRQRRERQAVDETARSKTDPSLSVLPAASTRMQIEEDIIDRIIVRRALGRMSNVRSRAIVAVELGFDVAPFLDELAQRLGRDAVELAAQLEAIAPGDESALVRVFHPPPEPLLKANDNFARARRRALQELRTSFVLERRS